MSQDCGFFLGIRSSSKLLLISDVTSGLRVGVPASEKSERNKWVSIAITILNSISGRKTSIMDNEYKIEPSVSGTEVLVSLIGSGPIGKGPWTHHGCTWPVASPIGPSAGIWSEDSAFAGSPERSHNAQLHPSRSSGEVVQKSRRFGLWAAVRTRLWWKIQVLVKAGSVSAQKQTRLLTGAFLAGVSQVIVAGHVAPAAAIVPHHHNAVFAWEKIAVWLPPVPVLIQLRRDRTVKPSLKPVLFLTTVTLPHLQHFNIFSRIVGVMSQIVSRLCLGASQKPRACPQTWKEDFSFNRKKPRGGPRPPADGLSGWKYRHTGHMHAHNCLMLKVAGLKLGRSVVLIGRSGHGGCNRVVFCIKAAYQRVAVRPAEIILNGFVIQAGPLVLFIVAWWGQEKTSSICFFSRIWAKQQDLDSLLM